MLEQNPRQSFSHIPIARSSTQLVSAYQRWHTLAALYLCFFSAAIIGKSSHYSACRDQSELAGLGLHPGTHCGLFSGRCLQETRGAASRGGARGRFAPACLQPPQIARGRPPRIHQGLTSGGRKQRLGFFNAQIDLTTQSCGCARSTEKFGSREARRRGRLGLGRHVAAGVPCRQHSAYP